MSRNSELKPMGTAIIYDGGYSDPILLKENAVCKLYRVSKAGKYFVIKRAADNSGRNISLYNRKSVFSIYYPKRFVKGKQKFILRKK